SVPLSALVGPAFVAQVHDEATVVSADILDRLVPNDVTRILLETRNSGWSTSGEPFREDYVACDESVIEW
ncbi:MAG: hypothetical protein GWN07_06085, partial [Actinobacteria bacterium]|nr:hypothetical protein [Actinomycetota bacterium]NIU65062.1 hypothetical protein [Actinomycetota bacterium]NIW26861.1 hypothetical protein [Actinomycetota bacterium]NIX19417.1 hypothetical protein [Actinomycetota bacterium]